MNVNVSKNCLCESVNRRSRYLRQTWMWLTHSATVCIYLYVYARARLYICIYMYIHTYINTHIWIHIHAYVCSSYTVNKELHLEVVYIFFFDKSELPSRKSNLFRVIPELHRHGLFPLLKNE
jgi:hypothetical protein